MGLARGELLSDGSADAAHSRSRTTLAGWSPLQRGTPSCLAHTGERG